MMNPESQTAPFQTRRHESRLADTAENDPAANLAREADFVFRIAYCVTTGRNTEYAIRTVVNTANVGLTSLPHPNDILFFKETLP